MKLADDERELIREAIGLGRVKQGGLANDIGLAASALSEILREHGDRAISQDRLDALLLNLHEALGQRLERADSALTARLRIRIEGVLKEIAAFRDRSAPPGFATLVPGAVLPADISARLSLVNAIESRVRIARGLHVCFVPHKMGASSIVARVAAQIAKKGSNGESWNVVKIGTPGQKDSAKGFFEAFLLPVLGDRDAVSQIVNHDQPFPAAWNALTTYFENARLENEQAVQETQMRFKEARRARAVAAKIRRDSGGLQPPHNNNTDSADEEGADQPMTSTAAERTLFVIDRLDAWFVNCLRKDHTGNSCLEILNFLRKFDEGALNKAAAVLAMTTPFPIVLANLNALALMSAAFRSVDRSNVNVILDSQVVEMASLMEMAVDPSIAREILMACNGNVFFVHALLYLHKNKRALLDAEEDIRQALDQKTPRLNIEGWDTITIEIASYRISVITAFKSYIQLLNSGGAAANEFNDSATVLTRLYESQGSCLEESDLALRPIKWLLENGLLSVDFMPRLYRPVFREFIFALSTESKGPQHAKP